eukprot:gene13405-4031_t
MEWEFKINVLLTVCHPDPQNKWAKDWNFQNKWIFSVKYNKDYKDKYFSTGNESNRD